MMQKEFMTDKEAFIYSVEKAGIKIQYYLDTKDEKYMREVVNYIRVANVLIDKMGIK